MGAHLIPTLPLIKGETPSGYVSRTAQLYETTARDLSTDLGMRWPHLCSGYVEQLKRLSWLTGFALDDLRQGAARKILNGHYEIGRTTATTGVFRKTTTALCPQCVMEAWETHGAAGLYQLLEWSVRCLGRCEKHSCALIILPSAGHSHVSAIVPVKLARTTDQRSLIIVCFKFCNFRERICFGKIDVPSRKLICEAVCADSG